MGGKGGILAVYWSKDRQHLDLELRTDDAWKGRHAHHAHAHGHESHDVAWLLLVAVGCWLFPLFRLLLVSVALATSSWLKFEDETYGRCHDASSSRRPSRWTAASRRDATPFLWPVGGHGLPILGAQPLWPMHHPLFRSR